MYIGGTYIKVDVFIYLLLLLRLVYANSKILTFDLCWRINIEVVFLILLLRQS